MSILALDRVTAGYVDEIDILRDISLEVDEKSVTGIIGANGAGKSTLLKTIFGFLHPRIGRILFDGKEIQGMYPHHMKQMGISYMLQEYSTFPEMSVENNLLLGAWTFKNDKKRTAERMHDVFTLFPVLRERKRENANYLSGGQLRALSLGKEIMSKPKLLMVDEPSVGLQPSIVTEIYTLLKVVASEGTTILIVDQNIMKAFEISEYMFMMDMGRIRHEGKKADFEEHIREMIRTSLMAD
jgi:branched-chain amino acid transport system ATP-binding protein